MNKRLMPAGLLLALNVLLCLPLFHVEYLNDFQSNEGSWIAFARFLIRYWPHIRWYPWTDGGMPIEATYLPLVQTLTAAGAAIAHASPALVFHILSASAYALAPVSLFLFAAHISGRTAPAFAAALLWSLFSPSLLVPKILADAGTPWALRRLQNVVYWGETPHDVALALFPLALWLLARHLAQPRARRFALAVLAFAAVMAVNAFGIVLVAASSVFLLLAQDQPRPRQAVSIAAILLAAYLLICRALPPSLLRTMAVNSQVVAGDYRYSAKSAALAAAALLAMAAVWWATRRLKGPMVRFSILFLACFGGITTLAMSGLNFLPQGERYHLEMELGICLVAGFLVEAAMVRLPGNARAAAAVVCAAALAWVAAKDYGYSRRLIHPVDIARSVPYREARFISRHYPGQRAMVSSESSLWFNLFANNPQLSGGHEPTAPNWMQNVAVYVIYTGQNAGARDAAISIFWLKAFGCAAITVPGPESADHYKPFANPAKFEGLLPLVWREDGESIYQVPLRSGSLAHVIPEGAVVARQPIHGLDIDPARAYVDALEDPRLPEASLEWESPDRGRIRAEVAGGQAIAVQVNYDAGWRATRGGRKVPIRKDGLGMMVIEPGAAGTAEIELEFAGGVERTVCSAVSAAMAALLAAMLIGPAARLVRKSRPTVP